MTVVAPATVPFMVTVGLGSMLVGLAGVRGGIILVAVSIMIKFITLPLLGVMGIQSVRDVELIEGNDGFHSG